MRFAENARSFCRLAGLGAALLSMLTNLVSLPVAAWASPRLNVCAPDRHRWRTFVMARKIS